MSWRLFRCVKPLLLNLSCVFPRHVATPGKVAHQLLMLQLEIVVGVQELTDHIRGAELVLHCCSVHYLPKFTLGSRLLTHGAVANERVTENWHLALIDITVHFI